MSLAGIGCPIRFFTGISCLGCGMTRAWLSLLQANVVSAFYYHPFFIAPVLAVFLLKLRSHLNSSVFQFGMGILCAGCVIVYFIRLLSPSNDIVIFEPLQGEICSILLKILRKLK